MTDVLVGATAYMIYVCTCTCTYTYTYKQQLTMKNSKIPLTDPILTPTIMVGVKWASSCGIESFASVIIFSSQLLMPV